MKWFRSNVCMSECSRLPVWASFMDILKQNYWCYALLQLIDLFPLIGRSTEFILFLLNKTLNLICTILTINQ